MAGSPGQSESGAKWLRRQLAAEGRQQYWLDLGAGDRCSLGMGGGRGRVPGGSRGGRHAARWQGSRPAWPWVAAQARTLLGLAYTDTK